MAIILIITAGCGRNGKSNRQHDEGIMVITEDTLIREAPKETFVTVDVSRQYPLKELILQDIMDVEYIVLDNSDEFVCQGRVLDIGKELILVANTINDGDIFIFHRNGQGLRKINRKGQGPGEYTLLLLNVLLDEENGEIYVDDIFSRILVYDLYGFFLRSIEKGEARWGNTRNFNKEYLICKELGSNITGEETDNQQFALISKQDGSVVKDFRVYFDNRVIYGITNRSGNAGGSPRRIPIVPYYDSWLLMEPSSDTVFKVSQEYIMTPFMARTPPIRSMNPKIFLSPTIFTDRYYFMETVKLVYDPTNLEGFPKTNLIYDRRENTIFEYTICNGDYPEKGAVNMTWMEATNDEIAYWQKLEAYELIEAYNKGQLKGQLKEVAAKLDEDSNPVIMLVKYKN